MRTVFIEVHQQCRRHLCKVPTTVEWVRYKSSTSTWNTLSRQCIALQSDLVMIRCSGCSMIIKCTQDRGWGQVEDETWKDKVCLWFIRGIAMCFKEEVLHLDNKPSPHPITQLAKHNTSTISPCAPYPSKHLWPPHNPPSPSLWPPQATCGKQKYLSHTTAAPQSTWLTYPFNQLQTCCSFESRAVDLNHTRWW